MSNPQPPSVDAKGGGTGALAERGSTAHPAGLFHYRGAIENSGQTQEDSIAGGREAGAGDSEAHICPE